MTGAPLYMECPVGVLAPGSPGFGAAWMPGGYPFVPFGVHVGLPPAAMGLPEIEDSILAVLRTIFSDDVLQEAYEIGGQLTYPPRCIPDLDGSRCVGFADLTRLLVAWGTCGGCPEDLNADGQVGFGDLTTLLSAWGPC